MNRKRREKRVLEEASGWGLWKKGFWHEQASGARQNLGMSKHPTICRQKGENLSEIFFENEPSFITQIVIIFKRPALPRVSVRPHQTATEKRSQKERTIRSLKKKEFSSLMQYVGERDII